MVLVFGGDLNLPNSPSQAPGLCFFLELAARFESRYIFSPFEPRRLYPPLRLIQRLSFRTRLCFSPGHFDTMTRQVFFNIACQSFARLSDSAYYDKNATRTFLPLRLAVVCPGSRGFPVCGTLPKGNPADRGSRIGFGGTHHLARQSMQSSFLRFHRGFSYPLLTMSRSVSRQMPILGESTSPTLPRRKGGDFVFLVLTWPNSR